ncbi:MAG TPA: PhzF family phenazine biosynthesis protein [Streptosporangiaceae bacterium]|jgi:PhzF family phenazine biosynthesis protein
MLRPFAQVDVFTATPYRGNPLAVVLDADGLGDDRMQEFANWTNLSETTFVLQPESPAADYRVRIFAPGIELPFAGHPTLGSCHAWLSAGGVPARGEEIVQECGAGLIRIRRSGERLTFAAPPLRPDKRAGADLADRAAAQLNIDPAAVVDILQAGHGATQIAVLLDSAEAVLAIRPGQVEGDLGVVGLYPPGSAAAYEVRVFFVKDGSTVEDPVTGSFNAMLAQWLIGSGRARPPYVAWQGTALGRHGRVHVTSDSDGTIWIGGGTVTCITGTVDL